MNYVRAPLPETIRIANSNNIESGTNWIKSYKNFKIHLNKSREKCEEKQVKRDISKVTRIDQLRLIY